MKACTARLWILVWLPIVAGAVVKGDDEPAATSAKADLTELGKLIEKDAAKWRQAVASVRQAATATEADYNVFLEVGRRTNPMAVHGEPLIALAKKHAGTPEALCALVHVIDYADGDPGAPVYRQAEDAIELLGTSELHNDLFPAAVKLLAVSDSPRAETALRRVSKHSNNRLVRAATTQALVEYLDRLSQQGRYIDEEPDGINRDWVNLAYVPALRKKLGKRTPEELRKEAIQLAEHLRKEYADLNQPEIRHSGPDRIIRELAKSAKPQTYRDLAEGFLFEKKHLQVGRPAPEIVGKDTHGREFRLSDFRNKVVVLTFSADWCGACVAEYPNNRRLVERYKDRPFAFLSVVADEEPRTVDEAIANGEITWRCWYDGIEGPIARQWNVSEWPSMFLIDAKGIIRHYEPSDEKLGEFVEALVRKAEHSP